MKYKHYSKQDRIESIIKNKKIFLNKLSNCHGQKEFSLQKKRFFKLLKNIKYENINYDERFTRDKFENLCNIGNIDLSNTIYCSDYEEKIYSASFTKNGINRKFKRKYGEFYISIDLDPIYRKNSGYLIIHDVCYSLKKIDQYLYDLAKDLYITHELSIRKFGVDEETMPDDYNKMISRLFYFFKLLYKPKKFKYECETRIIFNTEILEIGINDEYSGKGFYCTDLFSKDLVKHICFDDKNDRYILLLNSYENIDLKCNI